MYRLFKVPAKYRTAGARELREGVRPVGSRFVEEKIVELAERSSRETGVRIFPAEVQAMLWVGYKFEVAQQVRHVVKLIDGLLSGASNRRAIERFEFVWKWVAKQAKKRGDAAPSMRPGFTRDLTPDDWRKLRGELKQQIPRLEDADSFADIAKGDPFSRQILEELGAKVENLTQKVGAEVKGSVVFGPDFTALIRFYRTGDFSTLVHEGGHVLRRFMAREDLQVLEDHYLGRRAPQVPEAQLERARRLGLSDEDAELLAAEVDFEELAPRTSSGSSRPGPGCPRSTGTSSPPTRPTSSGRWGPGSSCRGTGRPVTSSSPTGRSRTSSTSRAPFPVPGPGP